MTPPLRLAVVGLGRIGSFHARHAAELAAGDAGVRLAAVVDPRDDMTPLVEELSSIQENPVRQLQSLDQLLDSEAVDAAVVASPTRLHDEHTRTLVGAGQRVLLEKPLTASVKTDRLLSQFLDAHHPESLMLAFQRRFDAPLCHAKALLDAGRIGRPFKFVSILEDSSLMVPGYDSPGLLQDMSIHNIDEILWLSGSYPTRVHATGSRVYSHQLTEVEEDFDDALLQLWFPDEVIGQIQVSRNHVAGYRVETWIYGEEGVIHVGLFAQNTEEVILEAHGRNAAIDRRRFPLRSYPRESPEFMARFGDAYASELAQFVECCRSEKPFPVNQKHGLQAMEVIEASATSASAPSH